MIQEIVMHTEKSDIPDGYLYDTETPDFYVYRHKYTGREIHKAKVPPLYVNVQDYIDEVLNKIRAEIEQDAIKSVFGTKYIFVNQVNQILDKYKAESEYT